MYVPELAVDTANINIVTSTFLEAIARTRDDNSTEFFEKVELGFPNLKELVSEYATPTVHLWIRRSAITNESVQMYGGQTEYELSFFITIYSLKDKQEVRESLCKKLIKQISYPEPKDQVGVVPDEFWWINPQTIKVENSKPFDIFGDNIVTMPPWYVARIDLTVTVENL